MTNRIAEIMGDPVRSDPDEHEVRWCAPTKTRPRGRFLVITNSEVRLSRELARAIGLDPKQRGFVRVGLVDNGAAVLIERVEQGHPHAVAVYADTCSVNGVYRILHEAGYAPGRYRVAVHASKPQALIRREDRV